MASSSALVKYDQTPEVTFFLCCKCKTHIALTSALIFKDPQAKIGVFKENEVVNVRVDGEDKSWIDDARTYVQVYCSVCGDLLGKEIFAVEQEDIIAKKGRSGLFLRRLLMWNGKEFLYAQTFEPVNASKKPVEGFPARPDTP